MTTSGLPRSRHPWLLIVVLVIAGSAAGAFAMRKWMLVHSITDRSSDVADRSHPPGSHDHDSEQEAGHDHAHQDGTSEDDEDKHDHGGELIRLSPDAQKTFDVRSAAVGPGKLERTIALPGEVRLNADRVAHIVPRVSGMVREVRKQLGDAVSPGEVLAVLDSRELADAKAADLAAASRHELARATVDRIQKLFAQKIAPEEELLRAKQLLAETDIDHRTAEAKLHALGLTQGEVDKLHGEQDTDYSRYQIKAPFAGTVIEKHITLGEVVNPETSAFVLADLNNLWVDVTVYPQDIPNVGLGNAALVTAAGMQPRRGEIHYVSPKIDESTRTGLARIVLPNPDQQWRPGMFVQVDIVTSADDAAIVVPNTAIQTIEDQPVVFVVEHDGFAKRPIRVGRTTGTQSEVLSGLSPGERIAISGTFVLKAELGKAEAEHSH